MNQPKTVISESDESSDAGKDIKGYFAFANENNFKWFVLLAQFDIYQMINFTFFIVRNSGFISFVFFIAVYIVVGIPLQLSQILLGHYSKMGYLTVWKICPILKGLGIVMTIINLNRISFSILHTFFALKYFLLGLQGTPPYSICPEKDLTCQTMTFLRSLNLSCCSPMRIDMKQCEDSEIREVVYPALHYYKFVLSGNPDVTQWHGFGSFLSWDTVFILPVLLVILLYITMKGFGFFTKNKIQYLIGVFLTTLIVFLLSFLLEDGWKLFAKKFFFVNIKNFGMFFWMSCNCFIAVIENVGFSSGIMISIGSFLESDLTLSRDVMLMSLLKLLFFILFSMMIILCGTTIAQVERLDYDCLINLKDWEPLYSIVTEYLTSVSLGVIVISSCYFFFLTILMMVTVVILINLITYSVMEQFPNINIGRNYIIGGCFTIITIYMLTVNGPSGTFISCLYGEVVHPTLALVMILVYAVFIFWGYGVGTLSDDLYFISGSKPSIFWKISWHIIVITAFILTPSTLYEMVYLSKRTKQQKLAAVVFLIMFGSPLIFAAMYQYIKAVKENDTMKLLKPDPIWGPPTEQMKKERLIFNPSKFIRHKEKHLKCYHRCLIRNPELKNCIKNSEETRRKFYDQLRKDLPTLRERRMTRAINLL